MFITWQRDSTAEKLRNLVAVDPMSKCLDFRNFGHQTVTGDGSASGEAILNRRRPSDPPEVNDMIEKESGQW